MLLLSYIACTHRVACIAISTVRHGSGGHVAVVSLRHHSKQTPTAAPTTHTELAMSQMVYNGAQSVRPETDLMWRTALIGPRKPDDCPPIAHAPTVTHRER
mmetsp:Transcript_19255/g.55208  ORF Transcript_19255/g.55208 Transcript_19255/m.55208 type:complete len:101 (-) Transcript_19255:85-387(-)